MSAPRSRASRATSSAPGDPPSVFQLRTVMVCAVLVPRRAADAGAWLRPRDGEDSGVGHGEDEQHDAQHDGDASERAHQGEQRQHDDAGDGADGQQRPERDELGDDDLILQTEQRRPRQDQCDQGGDESDDGGDETSEHGPFTLGEKAGRTPEARSSTAAGVPRIRRCRSLPSGWPVGRPRGRVLRDPVVRSPRGCSGRLAFWDDESGSDRRHPDGR